MKKKLFIASLSLIILSAALWFIGSTVLLYSSVKLYGGSITVNEMMDQARTAAIPWLIGILAAIGSLVTFIVGKIKKVKSI